MAELNLKGNKLRQEDTHSYLKGLVGSIAARVLMISLLLLVLPLTVHTFLLYREGNQSGIRSLMLNLSTMARAQEQVLSAFLTQGAADLRTIDLLIDFPHGTHTATSEQLHYLNEKFAEIAVEQNYDSLFYQTLNSNHELECIVAADPDRIGKANLIGQQYEKVQTLSVYPFLQTDPLKSGEYLFLSILTQDVPVSPIPGVLTFGVLAKGLIDKMSHVQGVEYTVKLALIDNEDKVVAVSDPDLNVAPLLKFSLEDLEAIQNEAYLDYEKEVNELPYNGNIGVNLPIANNAFYLLVALPKSLLLQYTKEQTTSHLLRLSVLFALLGGSAVMLLVSRVTKPLKDLAASMGKVALGDLTARYTPDRMGFEINLLGKDFNHMVEAITFHMKEAKDQRLAKELLEQEMGIGREIQRAIIPWVMPKIPGYELAAGFAPAQEVGGDFYDVFLHQKENKLLFAIADASGKGIYACLYSLCVRSMLRSFEYSLNSLQKIVESTNRVFCLDTGMTGVFVTLWVGVLDLSTGELEFCSCGHPPALLRKKQGVIHELKTSGMALGVTEDLAVEIGHQKLEEEDLLLLYTDGATDAHNFEGEMFGLERIKRNLESYAGSTMSFFTNSLTKDIEQHMAGTKQFDDLTLFCIKKVPKEENLS